MLSSYVTHSLCKVSRILKYYINRSVTNEEVLENSYSSKHQIALSDFHCKEISYILKFLRRYN